MSTQQTLRDILAEFVGNPPGSIGVTVIHLRRAKEREMTIRALEAALEHPIERFEAVDGVGAIEAGHPVICATEPGKMRSAGEIGCLLSHVELMRQALAAGKTHMMVFEDDCRVGPEFSLAALGSYLRRAVELAEQFSVEGAKEFILLGTCGCYTWKFLTTGVKATDNFNGSHAYLIGRGMMEKFIGSYEYLLRNRIVVPADGLLGLLLRSQKCWALCPENEVGLFVQDREKPSYILGDGELLRKE